MATIAFLIAMYGVGATRNESAVFAFVIGVANYFNVRPISDSAEKACQNSPDALSPLHL